MWSPVNESYASSAYPFGTQPSINALNELNIEYPPPEEPDYDPLIVVQATEAWREGTPIHRLLSFSGAL